MLLFRLRLLWFRRRTSCFWNSNIILLSCIFVRKCTAYRLGGLPPLSRLHGKMWPRLTGLPYLADRATRLGGLPHLSCKHVQITMRDYMERRVTSPTWGPPPPCKQAIREYQLVLPKSRGSFVGLVEVGNNSFATCRSWFNVEVIRCKKPVLYNLVPRAFSQS